jgi:class 3 adenylate cyclase
MAELPSGTVTFLFTDLEGSTRLWEREPDAMRRALVRHDVMLREAVAKQHGHVVKGTGDGIHAVFATADSAVQAAVDAQLALVGEAWELREPLRVRMGVHTGVAELRDGDYFGPAVNRAARLMSVAHGGQVVVSLATEELARDRLPDGVALEALGEHHVRDVGRPEVVFQVRHPGLGVVFLRCGRWNGSPGSCPCVLRALWVASASWRGCSTRSTEPAWSP